MMWLGCQRWHECAKFISELYPIKYLWESLRVVSSLSQVTKHRVPSWWKDDFIWVQHVQSTAADTNTANKISWWVLTKELNYCQLLPGLKLIATIQQLCGVHILKILFTFYCFVSKFRGTENLSNFPQITQLVTRVNPFKGELVLCYKTNTANHCNVQIFTVPLKILWSWEFNVSEFQFCKF